MQKITSFLKMEKVFQVTLKRQNKREGKKKQGGQKHVWSREGIGRMHFTFFQKISAEKPFSVMLPWILFVVGSKKKTAGFAPLKHLS